MNLPLVRKIILINLKRKRSVKYEISMKTKKKLSKLSSYHLYIVISIFFNQINSNK